MRSHNEKLSLIGTLVLVLTAACASSQLPETTVGAKRTEAQTQQKANVVAAIVKAKKANLRDRPSQSATVVSTVSKGALLSLTSAEPIGPWYQIRDDKTGTEGWIHGSTIALLQTTDATTSSASSVEVPQTTSTQRPRKVSRSASDASSPVSGNSEPASGRSYVNVDGVRVQSPVFSDTRPAGASARCRDGSYSFSLHRRGTCSHHGGVAEWY